MQVRGISGLPRVSFRLLLISSRTGNSFISWYLNASLCLLQRRHSPYFLLGDWYVFSGVLGCPRLHFCLRLNNTSSASSRYSVFSLGRGIKVFSCEGGILPVVGVIWHNSHFLVSFSPGG